MKNVLISCISLFKESQMLENGNLKDPYSYSSEGITVEAYQTNEACVKFMLKKLPRLDSYIRVQSNGVKQHDFTMPYLESSISAFCKKEGIAIPSYYDCFLGEDEIEHRYDRVLNEISREILKIAGDDTDVGIYLDMAGGKRDNYIFIQLLTKLLSFYNYDVHTYYADIITGKKGEMVNTDLSFRHMKILDAVNVFIQFGTVAPLRECFKDSKSNTVRALLKAMERFSNSVQLCYTDLTKIIPLLNQNLEQVEKNVSCDADDLFVIRTMIPLIRKKFDIKGGEGNREVLNIVMWCLENDLIQQALTIYNEKVISLVIGKKMIDIDERVHGKDINEMMKGVHQSKRDVTKLRCMLGKAFEKMYNAPDTGTKEMKNTIGKYKNNLRRMGRNLTGIYGYHSLEWTIGSVFWSERFIPAGVKCNIDNVLCSMILSDICFVNNARNRVNHASDSDGDDFFASLFKIRSYPFSSFTDAFSPQNVKADLFRAVKNLEDAFDAIGK